MEIPEEMEICADRLEISRKLSIAYQINGVLALLMKVMLWNGQKGTSYAKHQMYYATKNYSLSHVIFIRDVVKDWEIIGAVTNVI